MGTAPTVVGKEHPPWQAQVEGSELGPGVGHPSQTESPAHLSLCLLCFMCTATRWGHNRMVDAKDLRALETEPRCKMQPRVSARFGGQSWNRPWSWVWR